MLFCINIGSAQQWNLLNTPSQRNLYGCWFDATNPKYGMAVGWYLQVGDLIPFAFRTNNGGMTINTQSLFQVYFYASEDVAFTNSNNGVVVGNGILHTSDGGATWNIVEDATATQGGKLKSVCFTGPAIGYATGQRYDFNYQYLEGVLYKTSNGGGSWVNFTVSSEANFENTDFRVVCSPSPDTLLAGAYSSFGTGSTLFKSIDDGVSWAALPFYENIYAMQFTDSDTGLMAAEDGIYKTTNGGDTWNLVYSTSVPVRSICLNNGNGFAGGQMGELYQTTDNGNTWMLMSSPASATINDICMPTPTIAYAVGMSGTFLKYDGATALNEPAQDDYLLYAVGSELAINFNEQGVDKVEIDLFSTEGKHVISWNGVLPAKIESGIEEAGIYVVRVTNSRKSECFKIYLNPVKQ